MTDMDDTDTMTDMDDTDTITQIPNTERLQCAISRKIMDHPVTVRVDHPAGNKYPGLFKTERYERKVLRSELLKRDAFKDMGREELKGHMVELPDVLDEIKWKLELTGWTQGRVPKAWRAQLAETYVLIRQRVPGALPYTGTHVMQDDVNRFLDGRCRTSEWKPQDCDIMVAAEMCRWHLNWAIRGDMYDAMAGALGTHVLSDAQEIWAKRGYFDAVQDNIHGSRVDWIQKGARDAVIQYRMDEWETRPQLRKKFTQAVNGSVPEEVLKCGYRSALHHCEDRTTEGRVRYVVDWLKRRSEEAERAGKRPRLV